MASAAQRLDAADGVMDGSFFGRQIVGGGYGGGVAPAGGALVPYSGASSFGGYRGGFAPSQFGSFGGGYPSYGGAYGGSFGGFGGGMTAAQRLDAADGVMDGRHFGGRIVGGGYGAGVASPYAAAAPYAGSFGGFASPVRYGAAAPAYGAFGGGSTAAALDAADGVMDGRHFGSPIVGGGYGAGVAGAYGGYASSYGPRPAAYGGFGGYPSAGFAPAYGGTAFGRAAPAYGGYGTMMGSYGGFGAPAYGGYAGRPFAGNQAAAARLDAADGVMDGKFYGSRVVA